MTMSHGEYRKVGCIGEGGFGKVILLENADNEQVALKIVDLAGKDSKVVQLAHQEVKLLSKLKHEYILKFIHVEKDGTTLKILTEFCPNGDLSGYIEAHRGQVMDEQRLVEWTRQIVSALQYLHTLPKPVIHRDLKSANVFLDANWDTRLGDFGVSRVIESSTDMATTHVGTHIYMAPEMFMGIPYTEKTDIFSLSILMYEMACMQNDAFKEMLPQMMLFRIIHFGFPTMPDGYSSGLIDLMKTMMQVDPDKRPSATDLLQESIFKTTGKPLPIADSTKNVVLEDTDDQVTTESLTWVESIINNDTITGERRSHDDEGHIDYGPVDDTTVVELLSENPMMGFVTRVLNDMGKSQLVQGRSKLEKNADMLKMYCLQCMDNNKELFLKASAALTASHDEDQIEETLIRILGHERYGLCGEQFLHYKNYMFVMKNM
ncbi:serine/threonine-protein kinase Nek4-like [Dreissena polymorpha]|uniref:serine/threonine-protein kinase Nek4-like n=1 Tax=Dreissena polymorpha TaxID=45954 RepID=UPI002263C8AE|nr:serine/threonine-protein kinase Nek4-like [Dreissena polymorpha]